MSREYKDCDIVFDLLPFYIDGKTCPESNIYILDHFKHCKTCQETFRLMQEDYEILQPKKECLDQRASVKTSRAKRILYVIFSIYVLGLLVLILWLLFAVVAPVL